MSIGGPNLKLVYGLDESQATANASNAGSLGSDGDLETKNASTSDGVLRVTDDLGGKAADFRNAPGLPWTSERRWMEDPNFGTVFTSHPLAPDLDGCPAYGAEGSGWTLGGRFKWLDFITGSGGGSDNHNLIGFKDNSSNSVGCWWTYIKPDSNATPATGGELGVLLCGIGGQIAEGGAWSVISGGALGTMYLTENQWWRYTYRMVRGAANALTVDVWLTNLDTGDAWHLRNTSLSATSATARATVEAFTGGVAIGAFKAESDRRGNEGPVDELWFYEGVLSDSEIESIQVGGLSIPWAQPDYRRADHVIYSSVAKENADFPKTRILPEGATVCRHPVDAICQEVRARLEGWRPGRPWAHRALDWVMDPAGPYGSQRARKSRPPDLSLGIIRTPGKKPRGACEDARNVEFTLEGPRRRRGYKIRRDVSSETDTGVNSFYTWRDFDDNLHWLYKVGTKLYIDGGSSVTECDSGWNPSEPTAGFIITGRLVLLSESQQILSRGVTDSVDSLSVAAPASLVVAASAGGTLDGTYYYAVTLYDPSSGDETGPIISSSVSPSTQKVTLTVPNTAPDTRFTKYRVYRTAVGGSAPNFFYTTQFDVSAGTYDDTGDTASSELIDQVVTGSGTFKGYITSVLPESFSIGVEHMERAFYASGDSNPERVYVLEANSPNRNYSAQWLSADGPVRALASWNGRLVVFTDNTVEIVESDWIRDTNGSMDLNRRVVSRRVGAMSHNGVVVAGSRLWWLDFRGIFTMEGTTPVPKSEAIYDLFPYINTNKGRSICGGWNHVSRTLWWTLPSANLQPVDNTRLQTQFVTDMERPGRWTIHSIEASFVGQFDDDLSGLKWGAIDHLGVFKELESYEGDGAEGNETFTTEDEGTDDYGTSPAGIASISGNTITAHGTPGWTTDALRGMGVLLRDRSSGALHYYTIRSNTTGTFDVEKTPNASLAAGDGYYIGGMDAFVQYAHYDFNSPNRKVIRQVQHTFADLTMESLYL